jgi:hypothetical protein
MTRSGQRTLSAEHRAVSPTRQDPELRARRLQQLTEDIGSRLRRVCSHLSAEQFAALIADIADVTLKFEEREFGTPVEVLDPPRRAD